MTFCTFLFLLGFSIELLAAFNLREWAERKLHGVKDALPDLASKLQSLGAWLWRGAVFAAAPVVLLGILVQCTIGGVGPEADPVLNVLAFPFAALGTAAGVAFLFFAAALCAWIILQILALTPRGILAGIGLVLIAAGFLFDCG